MQLWTFSINGEMKIQKLTVAHPFALIPIWIKVNDRQLLYRTERPDNFGKIFCEWREISSQKMFTDIMQEAAKIHGIEKCMNILNTFCYIEYEQKK